MQFIHGTRLAPNIPVCAENQWDFDNKIMTIGIKTNNLNKSFQFKCAYISNCIWYLNPL